MTSESALTAAFVTFSGLPGACGGALRRPAEARGPFLARSMAPVARTLPCGPGGIRADHVLGTDETPARRAAEA